MGPPPLDSLQRSEKSKQYWNDKGNSHTLLSCLRILTRHSGEWISQFPIPEKTLESSKRHDCKKARRRSSFNMDPENAAAET
jgi:hypothetical protein